ncbi:MAG: hypothetical protein CL840_18060 [Crocinitomicaceae bacterium]|mgnify:CR=1 FL=1|nr:hypothetical protein [Crocinitomicaceae bacterium]|tara:strand:- start:32357 stop:34228 length:1872 start_codon:yes stop_codon:yes gene_type:complete
MTIKGLLRFLVISFFVFCITTVYAQQFNAKQVQLIEGKTYYLHKVEKGNTLYSLSKMYSIKTKDLIKENPQLEEGLKIGQVIRIPIKKIDSKVSGTNPPMAEGEYLIHEVQPKETMYSLTRKYNVSDKVLIAENPELANGLKIGMELKIPQPKKSTSDVSEIELQQAEEDSFITHLVEPKETLYSLALEYDVNIDSLRLINGGLRDGLKIGTTVRIPISKNDDPDLKSELYADFDTNSNVVILDSGELRSKYLISLLIPFYLDSNDSLSEAKLNYEKEELFRQSVIGMDFYTGFRMAVENQKIDSVEFIINVFDISMDPYTKSTMEMDSLTKNPTLQKADLIIGPLHRSNFLVASEFAKKTKKPIVSPVPQRNDILKENPYAIKVFSSDLAQVDFMRSLALNKWKGKNKILIENHELKDILLSERIQGISNNDTNTALYAEFNSTVKKVKMFEFDFETLSSSLDDSLENILFMPMKNKTFIGRFLAALSKYSNDYNIKVVGLDSWNKMGYLDFKYLNNLNVHMIRNQYIEYSDSTTEDFILVYRNTFGTEPSEWAFLGYDIATYFMNSLAKNGTGFQNFFKENTYRGLSRNFAFKQAGSINGFENNGLKLVEIENYQYQEAFK